MAKCPKCGHKLKLYNLSQFCPKCGVNMRFYGFEETFYLEAKAAELSQASTHVKLRRLKASLIGSKLVVFRLVAALLCVVTVLLPACSFSLKLPFKAVDYSVSGLGLFNMVSGGDLNYILTMKGSEIFGSGFAAIINVLAAYAVVVLFVLCVLISSILCFCSYIKAQRVICGFSAAGIAASIAAVIVMYINLSAANSNVLTAAPGFGLYACLVGFAIVFAINFVLVKKGIKVEYDEGMLERVEILKKVKSGEVKIEDLPQPIVETAATREIDKKIAEEEARLLKAAAKKEGAE